MSETRRDLLYTHAWIERLFWWAVRSTLLAGSAFLVGFIIYRVTWAFLIWKGWVQ